MRYVFLLAVTMLLAGCACMPESMQPKSPLHHRAAAPTSTEPAPALTVKAPVKTVAAPVAPASPAKLTRKRLRDFFIRNRSAQ